MVVKMFSNDLNMYIGFPTEIAYKNITGEK